MATVAVGLLCACALAAVSGAPPRPRYDQSQHGELNIHAQLDNIVVVVIPASSIDMLQLATKTRRPGNKAGLLQFLQKPLKDIDRYEIVHDELGTADSQNDIKTEELVSVSSQQVDLPSDKKGEKNEEKEEEVEATVHELKPETTEKTTVPTKPEATEDSPIKEEHSTVGETVQESVLRVSVPGGLRDAVDEADSLEENISQKNPERVPASSSLPDGALSQETTEKTGADEKDSQKPPKSVEPSVGENIKESPSKSSADRTIEDIIRPVAAKEEITPSASVSKTPEESSPPKKSSEPVRLVEGARREKVIRYKPDSKWAPGLVDLLGPAKPRTKEVEERQRFAGLCAPGVWDTDLKTCIMPGDSRSRSDLARFLEAMRLGIAVPNQ